MNTGTFGMQTALFSGRRAAILFALGCLTIGMALAQDTQSKPTNPPDKADAEVVGDEPAPALPPATTMEERERAAWTLLQNAVCNPKHSQTKIQGLAG